MRRRRFRQNVRDYSKDEVLQVLSTKLEARLRLLAPCPFKSTDVYRYCWTQEERAAIRLLMSRLPTMLKLDDDLTIDWDTRQFIVESDIVLPQGPIRLYVKFPKQVPCPQTESWRGTRDVLNLSRLPDHLLNKIEPWAKVWVKIKMENVEVYEKVDRIFKHCNTMGQVHRVWPNLCSFLPERGQEVLRKMKVKSRLPDTLVEYDEEKDPEGKHPFLNEAWTPKALAPYDAIITEALLLPDVEFEDWTVQVLYGPVPA